MASSSDDNSFDKIIDELKKIRWVIKGNRTYQVSVMHQPELMGN